MEKDKENKSLTVRKSLCKIYKGEKRKIEKEKEDEEKELKIKCKVRWGKPKTKE